MNRDRFELLSTDSCDIHICIVMELFFYLKATWKESLRWKFKNGRRSGTKRQISGETGWKKC